MAHQLLPNAIDPLAVVVKSDLSTAYPSVQVNTRPFGTAAHLLPEGLAVDSDGRVYSGDASGAVYRSVSGVQSQAFELWSQAGGYPIGLALDTLSESVWAANYPLGIQKISPWGQVSNTLSEYAGESLGFVDDLVVADDGTVYFTQGSKKFTPLNYPETEPFILWEVLEGRAHGRVLAYTPSTNTTKVLVAQSYFPSGIALNTDQSALYFIEVTRARLMRYWLSGEQQGITEEVFTNLPGVPDDVLLDENNTIWISLASKRDPFTDRWVQPRPWLKKLISRLPNEWLLPLQQTSPSGSLLRINLATDTVCHITFREGLSPGNIQFLGDQILLSTLSDSYISTLSLADTKSC